MKSPNLVLATMFPRSAYPGLAGLAAISIIAALSATGTVVAANGNDISSPNVKAPNIADYSTKCSYAKEVASVDPILFHGVAQSPHLHQFFGADGITSTTTPADLRARTTNYCPVSVTDPADPTKVLPDNSAYWFPALFTTLTKTTLVRPYYVLSYYRNAAIDPQTIQAFPQDLSMVAGDSHAVDPQPAHVAFNCVASSTDQTVPQPTIPLACPVQNGAVPPKSYVLRLIVTFPDCLSSGASLPNFTPWMMYSIDNPAYPATSKWPKICPDGYPPIPQLDIGARWPMTSFPIVAGLYDLSQATLDSDLMVNQDGTITGGNGTTAHADFMSGWTDSQIADLITNCYHVIPPINCGAFGNGTGGA